MKTYILMVSLLFILMSCSKPSAPIAPTIDIQVPQEATQENVLEPDEIQLIEELLKEE